MDSDTKTITQTQTDAEETHRLRQTQTSQLSGSKNDSTEGFGFWKAMACSRWQASRCWAGGKSHGSGAQGGTVLC